MSLDLQRLEKVRELGNGITRARCPACAEQGGDRTGEHLRMFPDGRFGCCVHPKSREHRKRIFALAGDKEPRSFKVKVAGSTSSPPAPTISVKNALTSFSRTVRTGISESRSGAASPEDDFRTLRTPLSDPYAYGGEKECNIHKDPESAVLSVLHPSEEERLPYLLPSGNLIIPFNCPRKYRWWAGGQSRAQTMEEFGARHPARKRST